MLKLFSFCYIKSIQEIMLFNTVLVQIMSTPKVIGYKDQIQAERLQEKAADIYAEMTPAEIAAALKQKAKEVGPIAEQVDEPFVTYYEDYANLLSRGLKIAKDGLHHLHLHQACASQHIFEPAKRISKHVLDMGLRDRYRPHNKRLYDLMIMLMQIENDALPFRPADKQTLTETETTETETTEKPSPPRRGFGPACAFYRTPEQK